MKIGKIDQIELKGIGRVKYVMTEGDGQIRPFTELLSIRVEPQFEHNGYGSQLINMLMAMADKKGVACVWVKVTETNYTFRKFLEKNGFTPSSKKILYLRRTNLLSRIRCKIRHMTKRCNHECREDSS